MRLCWHITCVQTRVGIWREQVQVGVQRTLLRFGLLPSPSVSGASVDGRLLAPAHRGAGMRAMRERSRRQTAAETFSWRPMSAATRGRARHGVPGTSANVQANARARTSGAGVGKHHKHRCAVTAARDAAVAPAAARRISTDGMADAVRCPCRSCRPQTAPAGWGHSISALAAQPRGLRGPCVRPSRRSSMLSSSSPLTMTGPSTPREPPPQTAATRPRRT